MSSDSAEVDISDSAEVDIAVLGGGLSMQHAVEDAAKGGKYSVMACMGNPFMEFPMAATIFLTNSNEHASWVSGIPENFELKGKNISYLYDSVEKVDPQGKTITFAGTNNNPIKTLKYKALIIATGSKTPLVMPVPGDTLGARMKEVCEASDAIAKAETLVFNGAGLVGLELAGDVRARYPDKVIKILSRDGGVLSKTHPEAMQARAKAALDKMDITVVKGALPKGVGMEPIFTAGEFTITGTAAGEPETVQYDFYMPSFAQGPNTQFLKDANGVLNERGQIVANECLQSTTHPEIFGVNITTVPLLGHPVSARCTAQARTCAANAKRIVDGKDALPHRDKEAPPPMQYPMNIKIGHGPGGYMIWDNLLIGNICCLIPCGGGFPFCPPPCCWCCSPGCAKCLGTCGGHPEGEGAAIFMKSFLLPKFTAPHLYNGVGKLPPNAENMERK